jgi:predicted transposase/invertase (TIGR01784 family)
MHTIHDSGYKKLFSNRTIFRQLLETFVTEAWVKELDFGQCETLDKSFVADHYKETESDLIYKVTFHGRDIYLVVLLEFQSTVDRFMALRVLNYLTNFYLDYVASHEKVTQLPPVFPIVLYNGDRKWTAPIRLADLIQDHHMLGRYAPQFEYSKIVEHEYPKDHLLAVRNIVSTLFLTESYYDFELVKQELTRLFEQEEDRQAVSLLINWFRQLAEHQRIDPSEYQEFKQVYHTVEEVRSMLITSLEREREQIRAEALKIGEEKGRQEGRQEGELIGEIRAMQKFLKRPIASVEDLSHHSMEELQAMVHDLETELATFN